MPPTPDYRDPARPADERVRDLLARMTLEEKSAQLTAPFGNTVDVHSPPAEGWGIAVAALSMLGLPPREAAERANELQRKHVEQTRLGIPVMFGEEALIGLKVRDATTFPDAIAQAATWNPDLVYEMAAAIHGQMVALGVHQALSPLADVARDPRWGRIEETYGEEPYLVGTMATAFVRGLQGDDPDHPVIATLKHFIGYGAGAGGRNADPASIGPRELREVYALPFEMAIREGGARGVMPSYNDIDGSPATGSVELLQNLLRVELGFDGLVISDLGAVGQLHTKHGVADGSAAAMAQALRAGVHLDLASENSAPTIVDAVHRGLLAEDAVDAAVARVLRAKIDAGLFERPFVDLDAVPETLDPEATRALARQIAEQSVILLRNEAVHGDQLLPLDPAVGSIAVIGPNADRPLGQLGNYSYQVLDSVSARFAHAADPTAHAGDDAALSGRTSADDATLLVESVPVVTFLEGIRRRVSPGTLVRYAVGCAVQALDRGCFAEAIAAAEDSDVAVVVVGEQSGINAFGTVGEGLDSARCELTGVQRELVEAVVATGTPTVVVLSHGRPLALGTLTESAPAIISSLFGGEEAGTAVARVLFGDVNPAGRLPAGMPSEPGVTPVPYWRAAQHSTYQDATLRPAFPFGHGLSYTTFTYDDLRVETRAVPTDGCLRVAFRLTNSGAVAGDEVVQLYAQDPVGRSVRRPRVLVGYRRLRLEAGESTWVTFEVPSTLLAEWTPAEGWIVDPGMVKLFVGASSSDIRLRDQLLLAGSTYRPEAGRRLTSSSALHGAAPWPDEPPSASAARTPLPTGASTVRAWLDHPLARPLLLEMLGLADESVLEPALGLSLTQVVSYSRGAMAPSLVDDLQRRLDGRADA